MTTPTNNAVEAKIRDFLAERIVAVCAKDVDALMAHHGPAVRTFDLVEPLQYVGVEAIRKRAEEWFSNFEGPIEYETRDVRVHADGGVAFCHGLHHVKGMSKDGTKIDMWWRHTECLRQIGDKWLIVQEHSSVPFDTASGKVSFELKP